MELVSRILLVLILIQAILGGGNTMINSLRDPYDVIQIGDNLNKTKEIYKDLIDKDLISTIIIKSGQSRVVILSDGEVVSSVICFENRSATMSYKGVAPIDQFDPSELDGKTIYDMIELLGSPHGDIGSGLYLPAYVVNDGTIVYFCITGEKITGSEVINIF